MHSILPIRITKDYLHYKTGEVVLVSGAKKTELLSVGAGEVFRPEAPMARSEFARITVPDIAIAHGVIIDEQSTQQKRRQTYMLENLKQQFNEALPAWLQYTATGKKLLQERDEALSKARSVAEATAAAEREELVRQYQEAVLAEKSDEELQAMIQKRDEFMAESTHLKTRQIHAEATLPLKRMTDAIAQRIRPHRERVDRLRKELRASAPAWQQAVIASFIEDLETIRQSIGSLTTLDERKCSVSTTAGVNASWRSLTIRSTASRCVVLAADSVRAGFRSPVLPRGNS